jgi:hypothetical protein
LLERLGTTDRNFPWGSSPWGRGLAWASRPWTPGDGLRVNRIRGVGSGPQDVCIEVLINQFFVRIQVIGLAAPDHEEVGAERREIFTTIIEVVLNLEDFLLLLLRFEPLCFSQVLGVSLSFLAVGGECTDILRWLFV